MIRTRISPDEELYERARKQAQKLGISLAELVRRGLEQVVAEKDADKPWMHFAGSLNGNPEDSVTVDAVVYDR